MATPTLRLEFEGKPIFLQIDHDGAIWYKAKPLCTVLGMKGMSAAIALHVTQRSINKSTKWELREGQFISWT